MRARKNKPGSARIDAPMKSLRDTTPYPVRLPQAHLRVLRKHGVDIPGYLRLCVAKLVGEYEKK